MGDCVYAYKQTCICTLLYYRLYFSTKVPGMSMDIRCYERGRTIKHGVYDFIPRYDIVLDFSFGWDRACVVERGDAVKRVLVHDVM